MNPLTALPSESLAAMAFAVGLVVGSFLNVVIYRLPRGESLVRPRSHCPHCGQALAPWDNVPVFSYLWLRGRCRRCRTRISLRYPAIELLTGALFASIALRYGATAMTPVLLAFAAALVAAAAIDLDHRIIPDEISVGGLLLAVVLVPVVHALAGSPFAGALLRSAGGALLGGGALWSVGFAHARISTALGRRFDHWPGEGEALPKPSSLDYWVWFPGVGFGDVKLLAMIGAVLGPTGALETILVASVTGLIAGVAGALVTRRWSAPFGFGPAIAAGALLVILVPPGFSLFP
jgi:leader peptidase (prepilin peptidase)/N-methyltransferase